MSKESSSNDWDKLWIEYNKSLKGWIQAFDSLQKAAAEVQSSYNDVMTKATKESSDKTMNLFAQNWQKSMADAGIYSFKQFGENWQNVMNQPGMEQLKAYGEMMQKFAETWQKMWKN